MNERKLPYFYTDDTRNSSIFNRFIDICFLEEAVRVENKRKEMKNNVQPQWSIILVKSFSS